jgi:hypothetical protein
MATTRPAEPGRFSRQFPKGGKEREKSALRLSDRTGRFERYCNAARRSQFDGAAYEFVRRKDCL